MKLHGSMKHLVVEASTSGYRKAPNIKVSGLLPSFFIVIHRSLAKPNRWFPMIILCKDIALLVESYGLLGNV